MAAPVSKVDICNLTMDHVAGGVIVSIDNPSTEQEKKCARWYDTTRRALLRSFPWTFARARFQASRDTAVRDSGWADAYNLPTDLLRLNFIGDDSIGDYKGNYALEGRQILLNNSGAASVDIGYTKDAVNVPEFDSLFVDLLAVELAWRPAFSFSLSNLSVSNSE